MKYTQYIVDFVKFLQGKGLTRGATPEQVCDALHTAQLDLYETYLSELEKNRLVRKYLEPFLKSDKLEKEGDGMFPLPEYALHARVENAVGRRVEIISEGQWSHRIDNTVTGPSERYPIGRIESGKMKVLPDTEIVNFYYYKPLVKPHYHYEYIGSKLEYREDKTIDIDWTDIIVPKLTAATLKILQIPLREELQVEFGLEPKRTAITE